MHWYFVENGAAVGPLDLAQMQAAHAGGRLVEKTQVCRMGESAWMDAQTDEILAAFFATDPVPATSAAPWIAPSIVATTEQAEFSFRSAFTLATATFKKHWAMLVAMGAVYFVVAGALGVPGQIGNFAMRLSEDRQGAGVIAGLFGCCGGLLQVFVGVPLAAGMYIAGAGAIAGTPKIGDLFAGFRRYWVTLGTGLVAGLLVCAAAIAALLPGGACLALGLGLGGGLEWIFVPLGIVLLTAGFICTMVFVGVRLVAASAIACDPQLPPMSVGQALRLSWDGSRGKMWPLFGFGIVVGLAAYATILLLCIGLVLIGIPFAFAATGAAYTLLYRRGNTGVSTAPSA